MAGENKQTKYTTSFIPKKQVYEKKTSYNKKKGPGVLTMIGMIMFLASIALTAGVYLWKLQVESIIDAQIAELRKARDEFDPDTIAAATRLNERIIAVQKILDTHRAPSVLLGLLEQITLQTVQFESLDYDTQEDGMIKVMGDGLATRFESVVLQSDEFGNTGVFRDVLFSEVQSGEEEGEPVTFTVDSFLEPNSVLYTKKLNQQNASANTEETDIFNETEQ